MQICPLTVNLSNLKKQIALIREKGFLLKASGISIKK